MSDLVGNPEDRFSRVAAHIERKERTALLSSILFPVSEEKQILF